MAKSFGLEITGTLGILLTAKNKGHIHEIKPLVERINQTNFRMSKNLVDHVLTKAGEK